MLLLIIFLAVLFGLCTMMIHMILPWLFGPMIAAATISKISGRTIIWPKSLADSGLFILGAQIGTTFTWQVDRYPQGLVPYHPAEYPHHWCSYSAVVHLQKNDALQL